MDPSGTAISFLDFAKAYDSVRWPYLQDTIAALPIPHAQDLLHWIARIYTPAKAQILGGPPNSPISLDIRRGVRQGDPLSPLIFNIVLERLFVQLRNRNTEGVSWGSTRLSSQAYADDSTLLNPLNRLPEVDTLCSTWGEESGVMVNPRKSIILIILEEDNPPAPQTQEWLQTCGYTVITYDPTKPQSLGRYLGIPLYTHGSATTQAWEAQMGASWELSVKRAHYSRRFHSVNIREQGIWINMLCWSRLIFGLMGTGTMCSPRPLG